MLGFMVGLKIYMEIQEDDYMSDSTENTIRGWSLTFPVKSGPELDPWKAKFPLGMLRRSIL